MPTVKVDGLTHQIANGAIDHEGVTIPNDKALAASVVNELIAGGFVLLDTDNGAAIGAAKKFILEPTIAIDPLLNESPWRIYLEVKGTAFLQAIQPPVTSPNTATVADSGLYFRIGSPSQIGSPTGGAADVELVSALVKEYPLVNATMGTTYFNGPQYTASKVTQQWPRLSKRLPMSFRLTVVERGFVIAFWNPSVTEDIRSMAVLAVQRGVGCDGEIGGTEENPLYLVTNISVTDSGVGSGNSLDGGRDEWYYNIVVSKNTSVSFPVAKRMPNNLAHNALWMTLSTVGDAREAFGTNMNYFPTRWKTAVTTDTGEYILIFPFGLCSATYGYADEIDLIAVSKGNAYQHGQEVPVNVYGTEKTYTAYSSNTDVETIANEKDTAIRVFILTGGDDV